MHKVTVSILDLSYMFHARSSPYQGFYVRSTKGNHLPVDYISVNMFSGRYFGLPYNEGYAPKSIYYMKGIVSN
jgi:hypothetical protein